MNAVFKLEVISFRKLVKDFACLTSEQPPTVAAVSYTHLTLPTSDLV